LAELTLFFIGFMVAKAVRSFSAARPAHCLAPHRLRQMRDPQRDAGAGTKIKADKIMKIAAVYYDADNFQLFRQGDTVQRHDNDDNCVVIGIWRDCAKIATRIVRPKVSPSRSALQLDLTRSLSRRGTAAFCAEPTSRVDVDRTFVSALPQR
jgi:hypothetical protein